MQPRLVPDIPRRRARGSARAGFSLVEIIVAMTLLAIVLTTLAFLAGQASIRARAASTGTYRAALASETASRFSSLPYDSVAKYAITDTVSAGANRYIRRVTLSNVTGSTVTKQVRIAVIPMHSRKDSLVAHVYRARPMLENVLNTATTP